MPKVPELDWSKLKPKSQEPKYADNVGDGGRFWRYKKKVAPKTTSKKHGKVKAVDSRIWNDTYDQNKHLKDIV